MIAMGALVASFPRCAWCAAPAAAPSLYDQIATAESSAAGFLLGKIGKDGQCAGEFPSNNSRFGGKTALCAYALLSAGVKPKDSPPLKQALDWLGSAKLNGTYAVAMRACALAAYKEDERTLPLLRQDVAWLLRAAADNGAYTYTSSHNAPAKEFDNSNGQMAVLGVWAAARRGVEVPPQYWQTIEKYWSNQQQPDGGWGYFARDDSTPVKTYGSMTAAGLATLLVCYERLGREQFVRCAATSDPKPIARGLNWLGENFLSDENPRLGINHYNYWLYCLERVGLAGGYKYFGGHNWYVLGARELLNRQNADGSWDYDEEQVAQTSFALLFLARGRDPVAMSKLRYEGKWNARPRDLANLSGWLSTTFERPLRWQVVDISAPLAEWHDSPVLYISGAGAVDFTPEQGDRLRDFVLQGGSILSESACNNADFTLDMQRLYKRLFPQYELVQLPNDHPIYTIQFSQTQHAGLMGLTNGVRMLAIHSPREMSLGLQLGEGPANRPAFELATNAYFYLTDKGDLPPPGGTPWPLTEPFTPTATIKLARVKYAGNCDPEPLAWQRLALLMGNRYRVKLEVTGPQEIAKLDAKVCPIAAMTGTAAFKLTDAELAGLKKYFAGGGRMVIDSAGGSREFAQSVEAQILPLPTNGLVATLPISHPLYQRGPEKIDKVTYRSDYAFSLGRAANEPTLRAVLDAQRVVIVFSREDLTDGLLGTRAYRLRGYSPATAVPLMANILCHLAGITAGESPPK